MWHEETTGGKGYIYHLICGDGFIGIYKCQNNKMYILNICSLLYDDDILTKLFSKYKQKLPNLNSLLPK